MYILVWVIVSMAYGPVKMAGTQEFKYLNACEEARDFILDAGARTRSEKIDARVNAICVEDKSR